MKKFTVKGFNSSNFDIEGQDLVTAIEDNFNRIARNNSLGNAAGYVLHKVSATYSNGILGGKGGILLSIDHTGSALAHKDADPEIKTTKVQIFATLDDLPEAHEFEIVEKLQR